MGINIYINNIGILLNIVGVIMVYYFSPINVHTIDGGSFDDDSKKVDYKKFTDKKNKLLKVGVLIIILGSLIQIFSSIIDVFDCQPLNYS